MDPFFRAEDGSIDLGKTFNLKAPPSISGDAMVSLCGPDVAALLARTGEALAGRVDALGRSDLHGGAGEDIGGALADLGLTAGDLLQPDLFRPLVVPRWLFERQTSIGNHCSTQAETGLCADWILAHLRSGDGHATPGLEDSLQDVLQAPFSEAYGFYRSGYGFVSNYVMPTTMTLSAAQLFRAFSGVYDYTVTVPAVFTRRAIHAFCLNHEYAHLLRLEADGQADSKYMKTQESRNRDVSAGRDMEGFCDCLAALKHIQATGDFEFPQLIADLRVMAVLNRSAQKEVRLGYGTRARPATEYYTSAHIEAAIDFARSCGPLFGALSETALIGAAYDITRAQTCGNEMLLKLEQLIGAPSYSQLPPCPREVQARLDEIEDYGAFKPKGIEVLIDSVSALADGRADPAGVRRLGEMEKGIIRAHRQALARLDGLASAEPKAAYFKRLFDDLTATMVSPYNLAPLGTILREHEDVRGMMWGVFNYRHNARSCRLEGHELTEGFFEKQWRQAKYELGIEGRLEDSGFALVDTLVLHTALAGVMERYERAAPVVPGFAPGP